jgi:3-methyladenine DNA glycosylase AlkD
MIHEQIKELIQQLEEQLSCNAHTENGLAMSKYMKDRFPFFGINAPKRKELQREWFKTIPKDISNQDRWTIVEELWAKEEREFHHIAYDYLNSWNKKFIEPTDAKKLKWLISNNSWWDTVDSIASNYLGKYCQFYPTEAKALINEWRNENNFWLNRSCLIHQLKYGDKVDFDLLKSLIVQYQPNKEFFIQKAIGWSLRQYSKYNPKAVEAFVKEIDLQGLAKREATKYI